MTDKQTSRPVFSFVVPVYNEEQTLRELHKRLAGLMDRLGAGCEVLLVDDGSDDGSYEIMTELNRRDGRFRAIRFSRNFGHQIAVTAGMDLAVGDAVIIMDADLQDPPEVVEEMVARWRQGYQVVYAVRQRRAGETWFKRFTAAVFYRLLRRMTSTDIPVDVGDFRLVDRQVVEAVKSMPEASRFLRGMFAWVGFRRIGVTYRRRERFAGRTEYPFKKMLRLAVNGVLSFSDVPLRLALPTGALVALAAAVWAIVAGVLSLLGAWSVSALSWLAMMIAFLAGLQLLVLGIVGLYLAKMYDETRRRPLYIVSETLGLAETDGSSPVLGIVPGRG